MIKSNEHKNELPIQNVKNEEIDYKKFIEESSKLLHDKNFIQKDDMNFSQYDMFLRPYQPTLIQFPQPVMDSSMSIPPHPAGTIPNLAPKNSPYMPFAQDQQSKFGQQFYPSMPQPSQQQQSLFPQNQNFLPNHPFQPNQNMNQYQQPFAGIPKKDIPEFMQSMYEETPEFLRNVGQQPTFYR